MSWRVWLALVATGTFLGCGTGADPEPVPDATDDSVIADTVVEGGEAGAELDAPTRLDVAAETSADGGVDAAMDAGAAVGMDVARADARVDARADVSLMDARADARRDAPAVDVRVDAGARTDITSDRPVAGGGCPPEMVLVERRVCVDRWEAALEEVGIDGGVTRWSPYHNPGTRPLRAVSTGGQVPQGYITGEQAQGACRRAGKRLCALDEWLAACRGPSTQVYPYGNTYVRRRCNEGRSQHPVIEFYGMTTGVFTFENMNNPGINMQPNTVAPTGMFWECASPWGVHDMVGNLHEWIADPNGTFKGGFYADAEANGRGCLYTTTAHGFTYRDYSTGFRCCADPR